MQITDMEQQKRILKTVKATESYVILCSIAIGILQLLCLKYEGKLQVSAFRYLRTPSGEIMSEASMMEYLRKTLFRFMVQQKNLTVTKIILSKQMTLEDSTSLRLILKSLISFLLSSITLFTSPLAGDEPILLPVFSLHLSLRKSFLFLLILCRSSSFPYVRN